MNNLIMLPILIPMAGAVLTLPLSRRPRVQSTVSIAATAAMLASAIALLVRTSGGEILALEVGGWKAPFGIVMVADVLSAIMATLTAIVGLAVTVFAAGNIEDRPGRDARAPLTMMLLAAVSGAFLTGDLFNMYVWYELMLLSSFVLLTVGGEKRQYEGAVKYVVLNLLSSTIFLVTAGVIYGTLGTLNMADLSLRFAEMSKAEPTLAVALAAPLLVAFAIKAAVFPFFNWLPSSYHTPQPAISALFAGLLTKVGVYSLIRSSTLFFGDQWGVLATPVLIIACVTMLTGVLGAMAQNEIRRILSFHIVSQIGYMLMGLGIAMAAFARAEDAIDPDAAAALRAAGVLGMAGAVFYILHHIIAKTNLFLIAGAVMRVRGTGELKQLGGMMVTHPAIAVMFLVSSFALAGIPILSGFWAKFTLVRAGIENGHTWVVTVSLIVSLLTLFSMTKIWSNAFWRSAPAKAEDQDGEMGRSGGRAGWATMVPIGALAALSVVIGVGAGPAFSLAKRSAEQLLSRDDYIRAVLPEAYAGVEVSGVGSAPVAVTAMEAE